MSWSTHGRLYKINSNGDDEKAKGNHQFDHWLV